MLGLFSSKSKTAQVGVDFQPKGVAVVKSVTAKKGLGNAVLIDFLPAVGEREQVKVLQAWVAQHKLNKTSCVSLIAKHDVQMFQLEKPAVEDAELLQAVSWKIKDLINFDVETAVVDVYQLPPSPKNQKTMINAVVANESVVGSYVDRIHASGLKLEAIEIHDLVNKNFSKVCDFVDQTIAVLQFSDNESLMNIYHNEDMYVTRDFKIGLLDIDSAMDSQKEPQQDESEQDEPVYDSLLLEIQRSLDYFESSYGMAMVQKVLVFPQTPATERMLNYLQNYVGFEFDFAQVQVPENAELDHIDHHCFSAYCASLRRAGS